MHYNVSKEEYMPVSTEKEIYDFLSKRRLAMIGLSRNEKDFSRVLFAEFQDRGYEMIGVHPEPDKFTGFKVFSSVNEIGSQVEGAILMTPGKLNDGLIRECLDTGLDQIWVYGVSGSVYANRELVNECRERSVNFVSSHCPFMFFPGAGFIHRFHAGVLKLISRYPK
jgi:uncharacterized protein